ncbi:MAG: hypothetical protein GXO33_08380 [Epsilonproteobacteria bacterium]|nr:hypothetical protein [Campylobacterota bacterium]
MRRGWALLLPALLGAQTLKIATYNVENLFDLRKDGTEYTEYIPNTGYGWNKQTFRAKIRNIAQVICDLKPDIIGLQEIESDRALKALQNGVKACGHPMPYRLIADTKPTPVKTALLSRFPVLKRREIDPDGTLKTRNILEATLNVKGRPLTVFVNHWKSRSGPESRRIVSAKALMRRLRALAKKTDYIVLGDFNSDWQEWRTLPDSVRLNDTDGLTGINHILQTVVDNQPVTKRAIHPPEHYDLWFDLPPQRRWSHNFYGHKTALDHILLSASLFDKQGINYKDKSFKVFKPRYLFTPKEAIFRWQRAKHRRGKHLGKGYSDHLPIYALFTTAPYRPKQKESHAPLTAPKPTSLQTLRIADLYTQPVGWVNITIPKAVVIYKKGRVAIIKEPKGRGILVYKDIKRLKKGHAYTLQIRKLYDYKGLREITRLRVEKDLGPTAMTPLLTQSDTLRPNEVLASISGIYRRGYLYYGKGKKIKLYVKDKRKRPRNGTHVTLKNVRVSTYRHRLELVLE